MKPVFETRDAEDRPMKVRKAESSNKTIIFVPCSLFIAGEQELESIIIELQEQLDRMRQTPWDTLVGKLFEIAPDGQSQMYTIGKRFVAKDGWVVWDNGNIFSHYSGNPPSAVYIAVSEYIGNSEK